MAEGETGGSKPVLVLNIVHSTSFNPCLHFVVDTQRVAVSPKMPSTEFRSVHSLESKIHVAPSLNITKAWNSLSCLSFSIAF
jgi:hypothetical protein